MGSAIEWTNETWNPFTGCTKLSPGCKHCYAERIAEQGRGIPGHSFKNGFDLTFHPERLALPVHWRKPKKIFVCSMSDLFHSKVPVETIDKILDVIRRTPQHSFQLLTKRCRRMREYFTLREVPFNAWIGVSTERQDFDWRLDYLRQIKAEVRWVSCEPLLGPLDLDLTGIHWVVVGGETAGPGQKARLMETAWAGSLRDQCRAARVPFLFKQWGDASSEHGRWLDGLIHDDYPTQAKLQETLF